MTEGTGLSSDLVPQHILHIIDNTPCLQNEVTGTSDTSPLATSPTILSQDSLESEVVATETFLSIRGGVIYPLGLPAPTTYAQVAEVCKELSRFRLAC